MERADIDSYPTLLPFCSCLCLIKTSPRACKHTTCRFYLSIICFQQILLNVQNLNNTFRKCCYDKPHRVICKYGKYLSGDVIKDWSQYLSRDRLLARWHTNKRFLKDKCFKCSLEILHVGWPRNLTTDSFIPESCQSVVLAISLPGLQKLCVINWLILFYNDNGISSVSQGVGWVGEREKEGGRQNVPGERKKKAIRRRKKNSIKYCYSFNRKLKRWKVNSPLALWAEV